jgi:hypothetical protein
MTARPTKGKGKRVASGLFTDILQQGLMEALWGRPQSKAGKGKDGGGKGGGKVVTAPTEKRRFCPWSSCTAAKAGKPTLGDKMECFSCGKHFSQAPSIAARNSQS